MAARKRSGVKGSHPLTAAWKERIKIGMLINRLSDNALGKIEMTQSQVRSAEILLKKVTPDLSSVALSNEDPNTPLSIRWVDK